MVNRTDDECAALLPMKILGKKWMSFIICELLMHNELYFSEFKNNIKGRYGKEISARVLSEALTQLEKEKILIREVLGDKMPIRVKYSLTEKGRDFEVIFGIMKGWGIKWGGIKQKKCKSFSCIHNSVAMISVDEARKLFRFSEEKQDTSEQ